MADYGQLDDFGDLTVEQLRNMPMSEYAELRSRYLRVREAEAREHRDAAFTRPPGYYTRLMNQPSPESALRRWWRARNLFIETGDVRQLRAMEDAVREEDSDAYDEAARA